MARPESCSLSLGRTGKLRKQSLAEEEAPSTHPSLGTAPPPLLQEHSWLLENRINTKPNQAEPHLHQEAQRRRL